MAGMGMFSTKNEDGTKILNRAQEAWDRGDAHFVARINAFNMGFATAMADTLNQTAAVGWHLVSTNLTTDGAGQTAYAVFSRT